MTALLAAVTALWLPLFALGLMWLAAYPLALLWTRWADRPGHSDYVGIVRRAREWDGGES